MARKIIGPRMAQVAELVRLYPGRPKIFYARKVGPRGSLFYGYRSVNRAIKAGLVQARQIHGSLYELMPN